MSLFKHKSYSGFFKVRFNFIVSLSLILDKHSQHINIILQPTLSLTVIKLTFSMELHNHYNYNFVKMVYYYTLNFFLIISY